MMRRLLKTYKTYNLALWCLLFPLCTTIDSFSQKTGALDAGLRLGAAYYIGDLNQSILPADIGLAQGLTLAYNFNSRIAIRSNVSKYTITGETDNHPDFSYSHPYSFSNNLLYLNVRGEFSFLPLSLSKSIEDNSCFSPYLFLGIGTLIDQSFENCTNTCIPFGLGIKLLLNERICVGLEWEITQISTDNLDGLANPYRIENLTTTINDDWFSFFGIFVTYNLWNRGNKCHN